MFNLIVDILQHDWWLGANLCVEGTSLITNLNLNEYCNVLL